MYRLFFELVKVSIGVKDSLSNMPTTEELNDLYNISLKQALVGICFNGIRKLKENNHIADNNIYVKWLGAASVVQKRNDELKKQCVEIQQILLNNGFNACVLKGLGVATLYHEKMSLLRQSGDIDIWLIPDSLNYKSHFKKIYNRIKLLFPISNFTVQHIAVPYNKGIDVEIHFIASKMMNPFYNIRLQKWLLNNVENKFDKKIGVYTPSNKFNIIYLLQHCYNHYIFEGVGLRQIMDYYFLLINFSDTANKKEIVEELRYLNLYKFATAMMWVLIYAFNLERKYLLCEPNEKLGKILLCSIMNGGNFGVYGDTNIMKNHDDKNKFLFLRLKQGLKMLSLYPSEVIWMPYSILVQYINKRYLKFCYNIH